MRQQEYSVRSGFTLLELLVVIIVLGLLAGLAISITTAALQGAAAITLKGNQLIAGVAINLFVLGMTSYVSSQVLTEYRFLNNAPVFRAWPIPFLSDLPVVGPVLFRQNLFVYGAEVVEQVQARHHFSASAQVIRVADDMWRALMGAQEQAQRR
jgi:prepilin-type N-terminal cleavage/methylation domain-containing protein